MKVKQLLIAVAATLVSAQALAAGVTPAEILTAKNANNINEAWLSGASAPTFMLYEGYANGCDANTMSIYTNQAASSSSVRPGSIGNFAAYACKRGGKVSVLYHTVAGGSLFAFLPHTTGQFENRMAQIAGSSTCTLVAPTFNGVPVYKGCAMATGSAYPITSDTAPQRPAGGYSDVESAAFGSLAGDVASKGVESEANVGQVFGVAVSTNLYRALQTAQGINVAADPNFDPVNAPNITTQQYTSIAALGSGYQADWSPILGAAGAGKAVHLARRVPTSGTQGSSNIHFMKNPCALGVAGQLEPATAADSIPGAFVVTENSGTGNVKDTITAANAAGNFAIGVVSLENDWRTEGAGRNGYRFVKLDSVHPEAGSAQGTNSNGTVYYTARKTAIDGQYGLYMELRQFVANPTAQTGSYGAVVIPEITAALAAPTSCADTPRGLTISPLAGSSCGFDVVAKGTRFGNNCKAVQMFF